MPITNSIEQHFKSVTASPPAETIIPRETSTKNRAVRYKKLAHLLNRRHYFTLRVTTLRGSHSVREPQSHHLHQGGKNTRKLPWG